MASQGWSRKNWRRMRSASYTIGCGRSVAASVSEFFYVSSALIGPQWLQPARAAGATWSPVASAADLRRDAAVCGAAAEPAVGDAALLRTRLEALSYSRPAAGGRRSESPGSESGAACFSRGVADGAKKVVQCPYIIETPRPRKARLGSLREQAGLHTALAHQHDRETYQDIGRSLAQACVNVLDVRLGHIANVRQ